MTISNLLKLRFKEYEFFATRVASPNVKIVFRFHKHSPHYPTVWKYFNIKKWHTWILMDKNREDEWIHWQLLIHIEKKRTCYFWRCKQHISWPYSLNHWAQEHGSSPAEFVSAPCDVSVGFWQDQILIADSPASGPLTQLPFVKSISLVPGPAIRQSC